MPYDPLPILGRVPSGIFILTAGASGEPTGMLASWVMQAGFEPPMLSVAVRHGRYVGDWLTRGEPFVLNVVGAEQKHLVKHFSHGFEPGAPAFEGIATRPTDCGVPALADAVGYMECEGASHADAGDHRVFLARVLGGEVTNDTPPMVHVRKTGAHY